MILKNNTETSLIENIPVDLLFVSDSEDVKEIINFEHITEKYDSFFVRVEGGEYTEVWGMRGIIPWLYKTAWRIK